MNKRFLSTLLTGAIFLAATSMFVACKDYDDDIKNLQSQIDKAALKSEVDALQAQLTTVSSNADAAMKKAEEGVKAAAAAQNTADAAAAAAKKAQETADAAGAQAAKAIENAAKAQNTADAAVAAAAAAQASADAAQLTADAAKKIAEAAATKEELAAAKSELTALANKAQATADAAKALAEAAATKDELAAAVATLTKAAADAQATADAAKKVAEAAATKAEFDAAVATLQAAAKKAQETADAALAAAGGAQDAIDALTKVAATKEELAALKSELEEFAKTVATEAKEAALAECKAVAEKAAADLAEAVAAQKDYTDTEIATIKANFESQLSNYATNAALEELADDLNNQLDELKELIAQTPTEAAFQILKDQVDGYGVAIDNLFTAVTSVEIFASYSPSYYGKNGEAPSVGNWLFMSQLYGTGVPLFNTFYHGTVAENSVFGDEAYKNADKLIEYKKGADIKDETSLIIRVNPVNADLTGADIKFINSLGEDLNDVFEIVKAERFNELLTTTLATRAVNTINSGLWKLTLKAADGVTPETWAAAVAALDEEDLEDMDFDARDAYEGLPCKKFAIAVNNTVDDNADRYVTSTFDYVPLYMPYTPATTFNFFVDDVNINNIRNRWTGNLIVAEMNTKTSDENPELAWAFEPGKGLFVPATAPTAVFNADGTLDAEKSNVQIDQDAWGQIERRRNMHFIYADVNEEFTLSKFTNGVNGRYGYSGQQIDYYYVVFDKDNAIESKPSEWNAWKDYQVEGLGVMTKATDELTMKITSEEAHGDVIGFRVYAVNRDGTLADPDGRAFYVFVGNPDDEMKSASANIVATKAGEGLLSEAMDVKGWFKAGETYAIRTYPSDEEDGDENPDWIYNGQEIDMCRGSFTLHFYDKNGAEIEAAKIGPENSYATQFAITEDQAAALANAVTMKFEPRPGVESMLDNETYIIRVGKIQSYAGDADWYNYATIAVTKVLPTTGETLEFRPKQETVEGSGDFIAYMIPNTQAWGTPWATSFAESYAVADDARDNGFKDLNNIFYDLNKKENIEFVFAGSLKDGNKNVDLKDGNGNGIVYVTPGPTQDNIMPYVLDVATSFIDGVTKHAVAVNTLYEGVSTYYDKDENLHYAQDHKVTGQNLTATYACWHHAINWAKMTFKKKVNNKDITPELQWSAEGTENTDWSTDNITLPNKYNDTYFGLTLKALVSTKGWLAYVKKNDVIEAQLNTKADGTGQVNPYFVPTIDEDGVITFTQIDTQVDSNPTADHTEYLILKVKDAFGHEFAIANSVKILKAKSAAPRF